MNWLLPAVLVFLVVVCPISAAAGEICRYQDDSGGWFRVSLAPEELKGVAPETLIPVSATPDSFEVFGASSRTTHRIDAASQAACHANMRMLQGAVEMYNMDNGVSLKALDASGMKLLLDKKYLRVPPRPPLPSCKYNSQGDLSTGGHIRCIVHGALDEQNQYNQAREDEMNLIQKASGYLIVGRIQPGREAHIHVNDRGSGTTLLDLTIPVSTNAKASADAATGDFVKQEWERMRTAELAQKAAATPGESVYSYILLQSQRRGDSSGQNILPDDMQPNRNARNAERPDLFALTTGALAIQESLQLDRMSNTGHRDATPTIPISKLEGPTIKSHPFAAMIGAKQSRTLPIDALVPVEFYACHFTDIKRQIAFSDLFDQWGTSLLHFLKISATQSLIKEKILDQLCLQVSELTRLLGDKVIDDLTICGSDPFLSDGTDFTVIFTLKSRTLFDLNASRLFSAAKQKTTGVRDETRTIAATSVRAVTSPDRRVFSFSCDLDRYKIYSNSPRAIERVIDTFAGRHASLGAADDLRYLRTIFPYDPAREDAFCYLSDAHIRGLVGPVSKIGRRRRLECITTLRMIQNAIAMAGMESGGLAASSPLSLAGLIAGGQLQAADLVCPEGGVYSLEGPDQEPVCTVHGRLRFITPILDAPPTMVSAAERTDYEAFVNEYNTYWSKFFDPVGIRGVMATGTVELETCILPLIENSLYNGFKLLSGGEPTTMEFPRHPETIARMMCKIDAKQAKTMEPRIQDWFTQFVKRTTMTLDEVIAAFGDAISINAVDSCVTFSFDMSDTGGMLLPGLGREGPGVLAAGFFLTGLNLPVYAAIKVKDEAKIERFLREWSASLKDESALQQSGRGRGGFSRAVLYSWETLMPGEKPVTLHSLYFKLFILELRTFYAVSNGYLLIANQRRLIQELVQNGGRLPEKTPAGSSTPSTIPTSSEMSNLGLHVYFDAFREIAEHSGLVRQEKMRESCLANLGSLHALRYFRGVLPADWDRMSLLVNGAVPFCPAGGHYEDDPACGGIRCSIHGDGYSPRQPFSPDTTLPLNQFLDTLKSVEAALSFTPEGIMTKVRLRR
ncbi:MAG: hypothetical protein WA705_30030 [Candidatus Ozemobacteraceae bacterium]